MGKPRRIHPTPAQVSPVLPMAVATLAATLSPMEKDVLFYLLFAASGESNVRRSPEHSPDLGCGCFSCYKVFWERWDASPNRQVIHEIIEKVEASEEGKNRRRSRRTRGRGGKRSAELNEGRKEEERLVADADQDHDHDHYDDDNDHDDGCSAHDDCGDGGKTSMVGRFVRFIGEKLLWAN